MRSNKIRGSGLNFYYWHNVCKSYFCCFIFSAVFLSLRCKSFRCLVLGTMRPLQKLISSPRLISLVTNSPSPLSEPAHIWQPTYFGLQRPAFFQHIINQASQIPFVPSWHQEISLLFHHYLVYQELESTYVSRPSELESRSPMLVPRT